MTLNMVKRKWGLPTRNSRTSSILFVVVIGLRRKNHHSIIWGNKVFLCKVNEKEWGVQSNTRPLRVDTGLWYRNN